MRKSITGSRLRGDVNPAVTVREFVSAMSRYNPDSEIEFDDDCHPSVTTPDGNVWTDICSVGTPYEPENAMLLTWIDTRARAAINSDEQVIAAMAMLKVAREKGDDAVQTMRLAIAHFLFNALGLEMGDGGTVIVASPEDN
jgi:hypothetical protein